MAKPVLLHASTPGTSRADSVCVRSCVSDRETALEHALTVPFLVVSSHARRRLSCKPF